MRNLIRGFGLAGILFCGISQQGQWPIDVQPEKPVKLRSEDFLPKTKFKFFYTNGRNNDVLITGPYADVKGIDTSYRRIAGRLHGTSRKAVYTMAVSIEDDEKTINDYKIVRNKYNNISDYATAEIASEVAEGIHFVYREIKDKYGNRKIRRIEDVDVTMHCYDRIKEKIPEISDDAAAIMASSQKGRLIVNDEYYILDDYKEVIEKYKINGMTQEAGAIIAASSEGIPLTMAQFNAIILRDREKHLKIKNYKPPLELFARMAAWW
jgi:hypothetical protein